MLTAWISYTPLLAAAAYLTLLVAVATRPRQHALQSRWLLAYLALSVVWALITFLTPPGRPAPDLAGALLLVGATLLGQTTAVFVTRHPEKQWLRVGGGAVLLGLAGQYGLARLNLPPALGGLGNGRIAILVIWLALSSAIFLFVWRSYRQTRLPWHANRALYWATALLVTFGGEALLLTNLAPLGFVGQFVRFLGVYALTHASSSYRLFDIRTYLQRLIAFTVLNVTAALPVMAAFLVARQLPESLGASLQILLAVLIIAASLLLYSPFRRFVARLTYRYLFGERINTNQLVRRYSQGIARALAVQELSLVIYGTLNELLGIRRGALLLVTRREDDFAIEPVPAQGHLPPQTQYVALNSLFITALLRQGQPLLQYEIDFNPEFQVLVVEERKWLHEINMEVYVPITAGGNLEGVIALGPKRSGATYQKGELDLLQLLADQTAVALQNARLYSELNAQNARIRDLNVDLLRQNERLAIMDKVKTDFITIASHELRTPLTQVKGYADILTAINAEDGLTPMQTKEIMAHINRATSQLERVIAAMLDASQLDADGIELMPVPVSLEMVLRMAVEPLLPALRERQIRYTTLGVADLPRIHVDLQRMVQAFANILGNAVKYTPDHGRIQVHAVRVPDINGRIDHIEVTVNDSGIGIDPRFHELIFEKFFRVGDPQLHSTGSTRFKGAGPGLGLSIAKGVIEAHNGRIWVESPGADEARLPGSSFHILLPLA